MREHHEILHAPISRRALIALLGIGALEGCSIGEQPALPNKELVTKLPKVPEGDFIGHPAERLNDTYLQELLQSLETTQPDDQTRVNAVRNSLRVVQDLHTGAYRATVFEIDASGYYIAAKHSIPEHASQNPIGIVNPNDGQTVLATEYRLDPLADAAVMFAPTGKLRQKTPGLQFAFSEIPDRQQLWMVGLVPRQDAIYRRIIHGQTDRAVALSPSYLPQIIYRRSTASRLAVKGMIPYGGMSGSPIVARNGVVVGIESGAYPDGAINVDQYRGAVITPLGRVRTANYKIAIDLSKTGLRLADGTAPHI